MSAIIQFSNVTQEHLNRKILDDLSFRVEEGDIFGLAGSNGSGKTTAIRIMAALLPPTYGEVIIDGHSVRTSPKPVRERTGYVPDQCGFYSCMTAWEYLDFFGACYRIRPQERTVLISTLLELVDLSGLGETQAEDLSPGMKQRLSLARALLHDPKVLLLDDPFSNLDPNARDEFLELVGELPQMGKTIVYTSQNLADMDRICNRVAVLETGKLAAYGSVQGLKEQFNLSSVEDIYIRATRGAAG
jgi:ABC-2 type transport system ATP-binding protein